MTSEIAPPNPMFDKAATTPAANDMVKPVAIHPRPAGLSTLFTLGAYLLSRRQAAREGTIKTTAGTPHDQELVCKGMEVAYNDILEWLEHKGSSMSAKIDSQK